MIRFSNFRGFVLAGCVTLASFLGTAPARACDCYYVCVFTYECREVPYTVCVTKYDYCGRPYRVYEHRYQTVTVPVKKLVKVRW
jgi:hypothetical protein